MELKYTYNSLNPGTENLFHCKMLYALRVDEGSRLGSLIASLYLINAESVTYGETVS